MFNCFEIRGDFALTIMIPEEGFQTPQKWKAIINNERSGLLEKFV